MGISITADHSGHHFLHVHETHLGDLNGDGHIDDNDALLHFGQASFSHGVLLNGDLNYVQLANGQKALILIDTAHFPENFDLSSALDNLSADTRPANVPGDFNSDGTVDAGDYVVWRKGNFVPSTLENYASWRANFGHTIDAGVGVFDATAVPEPGTCALAAAIVLAATLRSSRRRSPSR